MPAIDKGKPIAIYGAGNYGKVFLELLREQGMEPTCFVDEFSQATTYLDKPILRISDADKSLQLLVSVCPHMANNTVNLKDTLQAAGFGKVFSFLECLEEMPTALRSYAKNNYLWMHEDVTAMVNESSIQDVRSLLSDQHSRDLLDQWVRFRESMAPEDYIEPDGQIEYFPADVPLIECLQDIRFVDCGAYDGDTVEALLRWGDQHNLNIDTCVSFEPDSKNAEKVTKVLIRSRKSNPMGRFFLYPCGVWSENRVLKFHQESSSSSALSATQEGDDVIEVPVVALDSVLSGSSPNFIKMDIEGAEKEAIIGARQIIAEEKPVLAICVYHKPADIWELPLLINEITPDYDMYLRTHEHMCLSTVLYCLPRRR